MGPDSNDVARTRNVRSARNVWQCYFALNTSQAIAVGNGLAVIPAVNDL
jgi:hypothetical protein